MGRTEKLFRQWLFDQGGFTHLRTSAIASQCGVNERSLERVIHSLQRRGVLTGRDMANQLCLL
jgi:hypothetical protein